MAYSRIKKAARDKLTSLEVKIGPLRLSTPVVMASGTFGYGLEMKNLINYRPIGAIVTKTISRYSWPGNPQPRLWETPSGLINSIGLQNVGLDVFLRQKLPRLRRLGPKIIVSIAGFTSEEVCCLARELLAHRVEALEMNISCPNLKSKNKVVATSPRLTYNLVSQVRKAFPGRCLLVKLSPNVTDTPSVAKAAEDAGADGLTLINTVKALAVDLHNQQVISGGLSGPAIKPVGLRTVYEVYRKVNLPLIGLGGITCGKDALEYISVGASAVGIGSGFFSNPLLPQEVVNALLGQLKKTGLPSITYLIGRLNEKKRPS
ncbi:MAG: dihydroorotate dehydrogenase [Candidatus Omnitrophica bacterium]|nr:dihydroorotate dehydrogenase [Candidatus Omnitrophota bacterium]